jgi:hypothetical protein
VRTEETTWVAAVAEGDSGSGGGGREGFVEIGSGAEDVEECEREEDHFEREEEVGDADWEVFEGVVLCGVEVVGGGEEGEDCLINRKGLLAWFVFLRCWYG